MAEQGAKEQPVIVDNGLLRIQELREPDQLPDQERKLKTYLHEKQALQPKTGDQVVFRIREVKCSGRPQDAGPSIDSSKGGLQQQHHGSASSSAPTSPTAGTPTSPSAPQVAVLGSPQVPVGVSSALGYLHLGQVARVKVPSHLLGQAVADDEGAMQPVAASPGQEEKPAAAAASPAPGSGTSTAATPQPGTNASSLPTAGGPAGAGATGAGATAGSVTSSTQADKPAAHNEQAAAATAAGKDPAALQQMLLHGSTPVQTTGATAAGSGKHHHHHHRHLHAHPQSHEVGRSSARAHSPLPGSTPTPTTTATTSRDATGAAAYRTRESDPGALPNIGYTGGDSSGRRSLGAKSPPGAVLGTGRYLAGGTTGSSSIGGGGGGGSSGSSSQASAAGQAGTGAAAGPGGMRQFSDPVIVRPKGWHERQQQRQQQLQQFSGRGSTAPLPASRTQADATGRYAGVSSSTAATATAATVAADTTPGASTEHAHNITPPRSPRSGWRVVSATGDTSIPQQQQLNPAHSPRRSPLKGMATALRSTGCGGASPGPASSRPGGQATAAATAESGASPIRSMVPNRVRDRVQFFNTHPISPSSSIGSDGGSSSSGRRLSSPGGAASRHSTAATSGSASSTTAAPAAAAAGAAPAVSLPRGSNAEVLAGQTGQPVPSSLRSSLAGPGGASSGSVAAGGSRLGPVSASAKGTSLSPRPQVVQGPAALNQTRPPHPSRSPAELPESDHSSNSSSSSYTAAATPHPGDNVSSPRRLYHGAASAATSDAGHTGSSGSAGGIRASASAAPATTGPSVTGFGATDTAHGQQVNGGTADSSRAGSWSDAVTPEPRAGGDSPHTPFPSPVQFSWMPQQPPSRMMHAQQRQEQPQPQLQLATSGPKQTQQAGRAQQGSLGTAAAAAAGGRSAYPEVYPTAAVAAEAPRSTPTRPTAATPASTTTLPPAAGIAGSSGGRDAGSGGFSPGSSPGFYTPIAASSRVSSAGGSIYMTPNSTTPMSGPSDVASNPNSSTPPSVNSSSSWAQGVAASTASTTIGAAATGGYPGVTPLGQQAHNRTTPFVSVFEAAAAQRAQPDSAAAASLLPRDTAAVASAVPRQAGRSGQQKQPALGGTALLEAAAEKLRQQYSPRAAQQASDAADIVGPSGTTSSLPPDAQVASAATASGASGAGRQAAVATSPGLSGGTRSSTGAMSGGLASPFAVNSTSASNASHVKGFPAIFNEPTGPGSASAAARAASSGSSWSSGGGSRQHSLGLDRQQKQASPKPLWKAAGSSSGVTGGAVGASPPGSAVAAAASSAAGGRPVSPRPQGHLGSSTASPSQQAAMTTSRRVSKEAAGAQGDGGSSLLGISSPVQLDPQLQTAMGFGGTGGPPVASAAAEGSTRITRSPVQPATSPSTRPQLPPAAAQPMLRVSHHESGAVRSVDSAAAVAALKAQAAEATAAAAAKGVGATSSGGGNGDPPVSFNKWLGSKGTSAGQGQSLMAAAAAMVAADAAASKEGGSTGGSTASLGQHQQRQLVQASDSLDEFGELPTPFLRSQAVPFSLTTSPTTDQGPKTARLTAAATGTAGHRAAIATAAAGEGGAAGTPVSIPEETAVGAADARPSGMTYTTATGAAKDLDSSRSSSSTATASKGVTGSTPAALPPGNAGDTGSVGTSTAAVTAAGGDAGQASDRGPTVEYKVEVLAVIPGRGPLSGQPVVSAAAEEENIRPADIRAAAAEVDDPHLRPPKPRRGVSGWFRRNMSVNVGVPWRAGKTGLGWLGLRGCFGGKEKQGNK